MSAAPLRCGGKGVPGREPHIRERLRLRLPVGSGGARLLQGGCGTMRVACAEVPQRCGQPLAVLQGGAGAKSTQHAGRCLQLHRNAVNLRQLLRRLVSCR